MKKVILQLSCLLDIESRKQSLINLQNIPEIKSRNIISAYSHFYDCLGVDDFGNQCRTVCFMDDRYNGNLADFMKEHKKTLSEKNILQLGLGTLIAFKDILVDDYSISVILESFNHGTTNTPAMTRRLSGLKQIEKDSKKALSNSEMIDTIRNNEFSGILSYKKRSSAPLLLANKKINWDEMIESLRRPVGSVEEVKVRLTPMVE